MVLAGIETCVLVPESIREWLRCNVLRPFLRLLRGGVTPRRLAWSLALGMVVGINPSVGLTTGEVAGIDELVLQAAPQSLDENIVQGAAASIHADPDAALFQGR